MEFEKLQEIISGVLNIDKETVTEETKFIDDLGADSLDIFQIILEIEDAFNISIDDNAAQNIVTVGDAAKEIKNSIK